ncbi:hypothetical protein F4809DRAFT_641107 [Biscogniauxia mediterranea]|nr:hypothetical protein F4809DRAFT_641107 [Biscogniauxia mediterranea]
MEDVNTNSRESMGSQAMQEHSMAASRSEEEMAAHKKEYVINHVFAGIRPVYLDVIKEKCWTLGSNRMYARPYVPSLEGIKARISDKATCLEELATMVETEMLQHFVRLYTSVIYQWMKLRWDQSIYDEIREKGRIVKLQVVQAARELQGPGPQPEGISQVEEPSTPRMREGMVLRPLSSVGSQRAHPYRCGTGWYARATSRDSAEEE